MTATTLDREVAEFAAAVRRALADLPPDVVDDLVDGLEADLVERSLDDGGALGDPVAYADELRTAAGLGSRRGSSLLGGVGTEVRRLPERVRERAAELRGRTPALGKVVDFLAVLRPVWWVLRAWLVYLPVGAPVGGPLPNTPLEWLLLGALLVVSVQFGRGRWLPFRWMRGALLVVNVVAAIASPFAVAWAAAAAAPLPPSYGVSEVQQGLVDNGRPVSNVFAYDADGRPLTDVQLFDQDGQPLVAVADPTAAVSGDGGEGNLVPNADVVGRPGWNVYPLHRLAADGLDDQGRVRPDAITRLPEAPFATVKPLLADPTPTATPAPTPSATPAPSGPPTP